MIPRPVRYCSEISFKICFVVLKREKVHCFMYILVLLKDKNVIAIIDQGSQGCLRLNSNKVSIL